jgi:CBS domain containing-hemolysin-like protein
MEDLLERVLGTFEDETDTAPPVERGRRVRIGLQRPRRR